MEWKHEGHTPPVPRLSDIISYCYFLLWNLYPQYSPYPILSVLLSATCLDIYIAFFSFMKKMTMITSMATQKSKIIKCNSVKRLPNQSSLYSK